MPCRDEGQSSCGCARLHIEDATIPQLRTALRKAVTWKKGEPVRRKKIDQFVKDAMKVVGDVHGGSEEVHIIYREKGNVEMQWCPIAEVEKTVQEWLSDCNPLPKEMKFRFRRENGKTTLESWHNH